MKNFFCNQSNILELALYSKQNRFTSTIDRKQNLGTYLKNYLKVLGLYIKFAG